MNDNTRPIAKQRTGRARKNAIQPEMQEQVAPVAPQVLAPAKVPTKVDRVLDLLRRPEGATLDDLIEATGWLPHTTRAALTGIRKKGHIMTSTKDYWPRRYMLAGDAV